MPRSVATSPTLRPVSISARTRRRNSPAYPSLPMLSPFGQQHQNPKIRLRESRGRPEIEVLCPFISRQPLHLLWSAWAPTQPGDDDADAVRLGIAAADTFQKHLRR